MKRKFVKVMFFGALALSTVTYVGSKEAIHQLCRFGYFLHNEQSGDKS